MQNLLVGLSKYIFVILMSFFVFFSYITMNEGNRKQHKSILKLQGINMYLLQFIAFFIIYVNEKDNKIILFYGGMVIMFILLRGIYDAAYGNSYNKGLMNNMCMMLSIGFVMLTRLHYERSVKQLIIVSASSLIAFIIPIIICKFKKLPDLTYLYGISGIVFLGVVLVMGQLTYGANLSITIAGFTFQPSEFVKILFVFFLAAFLNKSTDFRHIVISAVFAGVHVIILVLSRDLGSALIFFVVYVIMVYVATGKPVYILIGMAGFVFASIAGYFIFSHVRVRVEAFTDPWSVINGTGYQVAQSLFAIGTGGFMGLGLYKGLPKSIPVVDQDFMFSAICEELGGFFGICLILLFVSCFMYFIRSSLKQKGTFYKLLGLGFSVTYAVQIILTIGGAIKFIPSTGVTLPLVSYGGSSVLCTMIIFAILQGLFVLSNREEEKIIRERQKEKDALAAAITAGISISEELSSESGRLSSKGRRR